MKDTERDRENQVVICVSCNTLLAREEYSFLIKIL